jgi:hypothetical protein
MTPLFAMLFPNQVRGDGERGGVVFGNRDIRGMAGSLHPTGDPADGREF